MAGGGPSQIHRRMALVLQAAPAGLTMGEWRLKLGLAQDEQAQLDRRKRDLNKWYVIRRERSKNEFRYFYEGERSTPRPSGGISQKVRAEVIHRAHGRCSMCGQTIDKHQISLVVDHKIPQDWGGGDSIENLWAICEACNGGKKNYFASQDQALMRKIMGLSSIHMRIGEALKAYKGKPVPSYLIEFVAGQEDWRKRTRELRYLKWKITASRKKAKAGKIESFYQLDHFEEWPENPTAIIRKYEKDRAGSPPMRKS